MYREISDLNMVRIQVLADAEHGERGEPTVIENCRYIARLRDLAIAPRPDAYEDKDFGPRPTYTGSLSENEV